MTAPPPPHPGRRRAWPWLALVLLLALAGWTAWTWPPDLPRYAAVPDWDLVDQDEHEHRAVELRGQVTVLDFIFTRCPDVCPLLTSKMAWLQRNLPDRPLGGVPIRLVSVSVDPTHDRPEVLAEYGRRYGADFARWTFLTGTPDQVRAVLDALQLAADGVGDPEDPIGAISHSERMLLIDADGRVRGFYRSDDEGMRRLRRDAARLARAGGR